MNKINPYFFILLLYILSFPNVVNTACEYRVSKTETHDADSDYFSGLSEDAAKQKCFSLSHSEDNNGPCCYSSSSSVRTCDLGSEGGTGCPAKAEKIYNNCGMAGIYQPITSEACTEISLVEGYCCYIKYNDGSNDHTACVRTKELNKNKNSVTKQILNYIERCKNYNAGLSAPIGPPGTIKDVICGAINLKYFLYLLIFDLILLL